MLIGLTGGIGSGKSTVSNIFMKYGIPVVDTDKIAREVVEPGKEAWKNIVTHFGKDILLPNHSIDRKKLGSIIFNDKIKRNKLNNILHPIIIKEVMSRAKKLEAIHNWVVIDIPLLFESKREILFDLILVVYVTPQLQLSRLMGRENIDEEEAKKRINSQMNLDEKKMKADIVIDNNGPMADTEQQVIAIIEKINGSWINS